MAEKGWRSPGEVWRAYEVKHGALDTVTVCGRRLDPGVWCMRDAPCPEHGDLV